MICSSEIEGWVRWREFLNAAESLDRWEVGGLMGAEPARQVTELVGAWEDLREVRGRQLRVGWGVDWEEAVVLRRVEEKGRRWRSLRGMCLRKGRRTGRQDVMICSTTSQYFA